MTTNRQPARRIRVFPEGTLTDTMKLTVSFEEHMALTQAAREADVSLSELVVGRALNPTSGVSPREVENLVVEVRLLREALSADRRLLQVGEIDEAGLAAQLKTYTDQLTQNANALADVARRMSR